MPRFRIVPIDLLHSAMEIVAPDPAGVLPLVQRLDCGEADVWRDGEYSFSARLGDNGMWCIFQRRPTPEGEGMAI